MSSSLNNPSQARYNTSQVLIGNCYDTVVSGSWVMSGIAVGNLIDGQMQNSTGQGDACQFSKISIDTGTYSFRIFGSTGPSCGKIHIYIDGVDKGNIDAYTAGTVNNVRLSDLTGVSISGGVHDIKISMDDKNVSSSNYVGLIQAIQIIKTA